MIDKIRTFNLNNRQYLYTKLRSDKDNQVNEKTLYEIGNSVGSERTSEIQPVIKITKSESGNIYSYKNMTNLDIVTAEKSAQFDSFTVSIPSKDGKQVIGYIKDSKPFAWTKNKNSVKLLKKITNIINKGL